MNQLPSMARRRAMRARSATLREVELTAARIGRATQAAHSTVALGDEDVPLVEAVDSAVTLNTEMPLVSEETALAGDDAWDAWDQSDFAKQLAQQLDTDLSAAKVELEQALGDAQSALADAGLARSEAAQAVADAAGAVSSATQAIEDALAAQELAKGAAPHWAVSAPTVDDAAGKPVGSIWYVRNNAGQVTQFWELTALGWFNRPFDESVVPQISIGSGTYGTMSGERLTAESVAAEQIAALAVTAGKIAADAVTAVKIAANAVTAEKINAGAVTTAKLEALAVTAEKLAVGAVVADKIAANAITAGKLAATAIDGMTITGALIRTAATGQRIEFGAQGMVGYGSNNVQSVRLTVDPNTSGLFIGFDATTPRANLSPGGMTWTGPQWMGAIEQHSSASASLRLQKMNGPNSYLQDGFVLYADNGLEAYVYGNLQMQHSSGDYRLQGPGRSTGARHEVTGYKDVFFDNEGGTFQTYGEMRTNGIQVYSPAGQKSKFWGPVEFASSVQHRGDTAWGRIDQVIPGATLGPGIIHGVNTLYVGLQARVKAGVLYISGRVERTGGMPANHVLFTLPPAFRPSVPDVVYAYSSAGHNFVVVQPNGECLLALASGGYVTISKITLPLES